MVLSQPSEVFSHTWANHSGEYSTGTLHSCSGLPLWASVSSLALYPAPLANWPPGLLASSPQLSVTSELCWVTLPGPQSGDSSNVLSWGSLMVHNICFPSFSDPCLSLSDLRCLENHCFIGFPIFATVETVGRENMVPATSSELEVK